MFQLFLKKKLSTKPKKHPVDEEKSHAEKRSFKRYRVDHKHLTLMNEQDILPIRDISVKGFCTEVSPRTYERMTIGDQFESRIRYLGEVYDLVIKVAWKAKSTVGFEIARAPMNTRKFFDRLINPIEIATSLTEVDSGFVPAKDQLQKRWFHSELGCELYIWQFQNGLIQAWRMVINGDFVEWLQGGGISTGYLGSVKKKVVSFHQDPISESPDSPAKDKQIDLQKRQLAFDIIMALTYPVRDDLLKTFS